MPTTFELTLRRSARASASIAVNPLNVLYAQTQPEGTLLVFSGSANVEVQEPYGDVVAKFEAALADEVAE